MYWLAAHASLILPTKQSARPIYSHDNATWNLEVVTSQTESNALVGYTTGPSSKENGRWCTFTCAASIVHWVQLPIGYGERCPTVSNPVRELVSLQRGFDTLRPTTPMHRWWKPLTYCAQEVLIFVLRKKGSKMKKRMIEEEIERGDCGPPTRSLFFFQILSYLNQAAPNHLADESQTRWPDTPPDHLQKKMADDAPLPALPRSPTGSTSKFPIGEGERCPTGSNPVRELVQRGSHAPAHHGRWRKKPVLVLIVLWLNISHYGCQ